MDFILRTDKPENKIEDHQYELLQPLDERDSSIFVSIASYRDIECAKTVKDLFLKAKYPERIVVGICEQNYPTDEPCVNPITLNNRKNQIRIHQMHAENAKGPVYARAMIESELFDPDESELFLQIDSHTRFTQGWDLQSIKELSYCPHDRCILTMYPENYQRTATNWNFQKIAKPTFISFHSWHEKTGFPMQYSNIFKSLPAKIYSSAYYAGNFAFGRSEAWEQVPHDIDAPYLFLGEEQSMAVRFYTHGWDLMSPMTMIAYSLNDRSYRKTFWEQFYEKYKLVDKQTSVERKSLEQKSVDRIRHLLHYGSLPNAADNSLFGLGNKRTLLEYESFAGYDFKRQIATPRARLGISNHASDDEWFDKLGGRKQDWKNLFQASLKKNNLPLEGPPDMKDARTYQTGKNLYPKSQSQENRFVGFKERMNITNNMNNNSNNSMNKRRPFVQYS